MLLFGALALGSLLLLQFLPLEYFYVLPVSARAPGSLFEGLGPAVRFWIGLLAIALVRDHVVSRRDTQVSDEAVLSTSTSGSVSDRMASVTFRDTANRTPNLLRVDVSCNCPWVLEICRNNFLARLMARVGALVEIGDRELDAAVVVQADDAEAVRDWLREPSVRSGVLSLFQQHKVESVSLRDGGSVLRAEFVVHNPFAQPEFDANAITNTLRELADTLSQR